MIEGRKIHDREQVVTHLTGYNCKLSFTTSIKTAYIDLRNKNFFASLSPGAVEYAYRKSASTGIF